MSTANLRAFITEEGDRVEIMDTISYVYLEVDGKEIRMRTTDVKKLQDILTEVMVMR